MKYTLSLTSSFLLMSLSAVGVAQAADTPDYSQPFRMPSSEQATNMPDYSQAYRDPAAFKTHWKDVASHHRIIVKYKKQTKDIADAVANMKRQVDQYSGYNLKHFEKTSMGTHIFKLEENLRFDDIKKIIEEIEKDPNVEYVEPDIQGSALYTPGDFNYADQWNFHDNTGAIRLPKAWDKTIGKDVVVAVIDTGYTEHEDLLPNLQLPGYDFIADNDTAIDGDGRDSDAHDPGDYLTECSNMTKSTWHGTHTAGTVAAVEGNNIGVVGVAFGAKVQPIRVLGKCNSGWFSDFADAIVWASGASVDGVAVNKTPAKVISLSLGGSSDTCPKYMQDAIDIARAQGATIVVAAGNASEDASGTTPANCNGVITVGATDKNGARASFSNYGKNVDLSAPGVSILSTMNSGTMSPSTDTYAYYQGTSMATPQVSGVAALLYSLKPNITPDEVEKILKDTAQNFPSGCSECGTGILDASAAVAAVNSMTTPEETPSNDVDQCGGLPISGQKYYMVNKGSGKYLDVSGASKDNGANVLQWSGNAQVNQQFTLTKLENNNWSIRPVHSDKSLDVWGFSSDNGGTIKQYEYTGTINQQWQLKESSSDGIKVFSAYSGKLLSVATNSLGSDVYQDQDRASLYQVWSFLPIDGSCSTK